MLRRGALRFGQTQLGGKIMGEKIGFAGAIILLPISAGNSDSLPEARACVVTRGDRECLITRIRAGGFVMMPEGTLYFLSNRISIR